MRIYPKIFLQRNCAESCHNIFYLQPLLMKTDKMAFGIWITLSFASTHDNEYTLCACRENTKTEAFIYYNIYFVS